MFLLSVCRLLHLPELDELFDGDASRFAGGDRRPVLLALHRLGTIDFLQVLSDLDVVDRTGQTRVGDGRSHVVSLLRSHWVHDKRQLLLFIGTGENKSLKGSPSNRTAGRNERPWRTSVWWPAIGLAVRFPVPTESDESRERKPRREASVQPWRFGGLLGRHRVVNHARYQSPQAKFPFI